MKKPLIIFLVLLSQVLFLQAQTDSLFRLVKVIPGSFTAFTVDNLDNLYILDKRNQLKKLNANGDSIAVFNNVKRYGEASFIDASNPLKVLLYYKDFATIAMLDRLLNVRNTIDLRKNNIFQVKALCQSYDNKIWLYDELDNKLKKIDDDGAILQETPDFRLLLGKAIVPVKIFDENKYVYIYDPVNGVYVFDYYGALKNNIMIQNWQNLKVSGKFIFGSRTDTLFRYEISTFLLDEWKMPEALLRSRLFNFTSTRLYALKEDGIEVYLIR